MPANEARKKVLSLIYEAQTSHIGSNFSCIDIMEVLFDKIDLDKDEFILSAGWKAASLYYYLWKKGRITKEELNSYCKEGSKFIGLSEPIHKDIKFAGGSMGMGLAAGVGFALAKKLKGETGKVYVLESDGGMNCGTTWEAIMIAAQLKLNNLVLIIDNNGFQAMGKDILNLDTEKNPLLKKITSFGWETVEVNGHDLVKIHREFLLQKNTLHDFPQCVIAKTTKGKGVSFMENNNEFHYRAPEKEEYELAMKELCQK